MPWKPSHPGEVPTLGFAVIDWITEMLAAPAKDEYQPFTPYREQEDFILRWYELDPLTCRFKHQRGVLGRPRGWGKSPILAALAAVEALGDVVPVGWDAYGQPVAAPWSHFKTPLVHIAAVSEDQTDNTWQPLLEMLREGPVIDEYPGLDPMDTFVALPGKGRIEQITASARSVKGAPSIFATLDQTEEWVPGNRGPRLAQNIRTNCTKNGGRTLESPNAYVPGEESVAEASAKWWSLIREGRARSKRLLYDHREAPADTSLTDRITPETFEDETFTGLEYGLRVAYGDSSGHPDGCVIHTPPCAPGHVNLNEIMDAIWDPAADEQISRSDYLNQITHASDSWVTEPQLKAIEKPEEVVEEGSTITLGFDGSRGRVRGKADATALIGCRVSDGHIFQIRVWEAAFGEKGWTAPVLEVDEAVDLAFKMYNVVGFYADPSGWNVQVANWEAKYGARLKVKVSPKAPISLWPNGKTNTVVEHVKRLHDAITSRECSLDGSPTLVKHMLNARRRARTSGYLLFKAYPESPDKIDAAYAAVMAWKARVDAVAAGLNKPKTRARVRRIR